MGAEHGRTGQKLDLRGIVIHYAGKPGSPAIASRDWFKNGSGGAGISAHYIVGLNGEILRLIPDDEQARHAGKSYGLTWDPMAKTNNTYYLGIEACHPDSSGKFSGVTQDALIKLVAWLMNRHGLNIYQVYRHYDVSGKICPMYYVINPSAWTKLKNDIQKACQNMIDSPFENKIG